MIKKLIFIYLVLVSLSIFINSCCEIKYKIVGKGEINAFENFNKVDTITQEFIICWRLDIKTSSIIKNLGLIENCNATTCAEEFENELDSSSFEITCDKNFAFNGNIIEKGTDISKLDYLDIRYMEELAIIEITFPQNFIDQSWFNKDYYKFKLKIRTNDNLQFENLVSLFFNIQKRND